MSHRESEFKEDLNGVHLQQLILKRPEYVFEVLYNNYSGALMGHLLQLMGTQEDAEEALQEAFVKIWNNLDRYDPSKGRVFTWMLRISKNTGIDLLRKRNNLSSKSSNVPVESVSGMTTSIKIADHGLLNAVEQLDEKQRFVVEKLIFKEYTQQELSDEFDIPLGTVKSRFRAAVKKLRLVLDGEKIIVLIALAKLFLT